LRLLREGFTLRQQRPGSLTDRAWIQIAADLLQAEARAVAANLEPMAFPSAAQLQAVLDEAEAACLGVDQAVLRYREAATNLRSINAEVGELLLDTGAWFRFSLRRLAKPEQRGIMRRFGFAFTSSESERPELPTGEGGDDPLPDIPAPDDPVIDPPTAEDPVQGDPEPTPPTGNPTSQPSGETPSGTSTTSGSTTTPAGSSTSGSTTTPAGSTTSGSSTTPAGSTTSGGSSTSDSDTTPTDGNSDSGASRPTTQTPPILGGDRGNGNSGNAQTPPFLPVDAV